MNDAVNALAVFQGELIAGGWFTMASGVPANFVARWNGSAWQPLGSGLIGFLTTEAMPGCNALTVYNGELIAGGAFEQAGGIPVNQIARWNGSTWQSLGGGLSGGTFFGLNAVNALGVANGQLVAGGFFTTADGDISAYLARWGPACTVGDLDSDGDVDGFDLGVLLAAWSMPPGSQGCGGTVPCAADLNADGLINGFDLAILLSNWG
jgi:hypothetical protein